MRVHPGNPRCALFAVGNPWRIRIDSGFPQPVHSMEADVGSCHVYKKVFSLLCRSEEHTSELQSPCNLVCRLLLEKKKNSHYHAATPLTSTTPCRVPAHDRVPKPMLPVAAHTRQEPSAPCAAHPPTTNAARPHFAA